MLAGHDSDIVTDGEREGGQVTAAREDEAAGLMVVLGGGYFVVVGLDDFVVEHH